MRGRISRILFEAYGIDKKYFPSASLLIRGPRDRYHQLKADAEAHGYYLTHFGLLPIEEALSSNLQERACFESDKKILFNDEDLYESFFRSQPIEGIKRELGTIKRYVKEEYKYYTYRSVQIEPTTRCNANCIMCYRRGEGTEMNFEEFCYVLDRLCPLHVKLWGRGETLVAHDCWKMIDELKERGIITYLTTNFNLDIEWEHISKVDVIYISLHTFDPEEYKEITGLEIDKALSNIIEARKRGLNIVLKSVVSKYNENSIDNFKEICDNHKLKYILTGVNLPNEKDKENMQSDVLRRKAGIYKRCIQPHYPNVTSNGNAFRCCMYPKSGYLGNVFRDFDINKNKIEALERKLPECKDCTLC